MSTAPQTTRSLDEKDPEYAASTADSHEVDEAHIGVKNVEAAQKVYGPRSRWALFIGIALSSYIYSLDGTTTWQYLQVATSAFGRHSRLATFQTAQSIIIACGKPVIAKLADVTSRGHALVAVLFFYVLGYIIIASASNVDTVGGGIIFYAIGYTGLQLLNSIIISDITSLQWRGLVAGLVSAPFIINGFVSGDVVQGVLKSSNWRWGYGMFAILIPVSLAPLAVTLFWAEHKARKLGLVVVKKDNSTSSKKLSTFLQRLDFFGLLFVATAVALILLPITLAPRAKGKWSNPSMIAMIVIGCLFVPVVVFWEWKFAKHPIFPTRFLRNKAVMIACAIGFFDFVSFYLNQAFLLSYVTVVKDWSVKHTGYFANSQSISLTFFGIMAGVILRFTHRYKLVLIIGLGIRLIGTGVMIRSRGAEGSDFEIVFSQILQGWGGGFAAVTSLVGAQGSVTHMDVAGVTAFVLLITEIGGSVGNAIAGAIWSDLMPEKLAKHVPGGSTNATLVAEIFGNIYFADVLPPPLKDGVINAYSDVMKVMCIAAAAVAVIPFVLSFFVPDIVLDERHNAVEGIRVDGTKKEETH